MRLHHTHTHFVTNQIPRVISVPAEFVTWTVTEKKTRNTSGVLYFHGNSDRERWSHGYIN